MKAKEHINHFFGQEANCGSFSLPKPFKLHFSPLATYVFPKSVPACKKIQGNGWLIKKSSFNTKKKQKKSNEYCGFFRQLNRTKENQIFNCQSSRITRLFKKVHIRHISRKVRSRRKHPHLFLITPHKKSGIGLILQCEKREVTHHQI